MRILLDYDGLRAVCIGKDISICDAVNVSKAQAKKIYEWGNEECYDHNGEQRKEQGWRVKRRECYECWQELLKELG